MEGMSLCQINTGGTRVVLGWVACPRWGPSSFVALYIAMLQVRRAPPPLELGMFSFVLYSYGVGFLAFCLTTTTQIKQNYNIHKLKTEKTINKIK